MRYLLLYTYFFLLFFTTAGHAGQNRINYSYGIVCLVDSSNKTLYYGIRLSEVWSPDSRGFTYVGGAGFDSVVDEKGILIYNDITDKK